MLSKICAAAIIALLVLAFAGSLHAGGNPPFNPAATATPPAGLTYHSITFDGTVNTSTEWQPGELLGTVDSVSWYLTWDATYIYVAMTGGTTAQDKYNVAIDTDPTNSTTNTGTANLYCGATFPIEAKPNYAIQKYPGSVNLADGNSGSWAAWTPATTFALNGPNQVEFRINRAEVGLTTAQPVALYLWTCNSSSLVWGSWPPENIAYTGANHILTTRVQLNTTDAGRSPRMYASHQGVDARTFSVTGNQQYYDDYANLNINAVTGSCTVLILVRGNAAADSGLHAARRMYTITPQGCTGLNANVTLKYEDGTANAAPNELNVGSTEATLLLYRWTGAVWQAQASSADPPNNKVTVLNVTNFSPWAFGGPGAPYAPTNITGVRALVLAPVGQLAPLAALVLLCVGASVLLWRRYRYSSGRSTPT
jgi:hypothetical protein